MLKETRVTDRVLVWTLGGDRIASSYGANCVAMGGPGGVVLVDPLIAPAHARLVERACRERFGSPIAHVVLTHHHTDHALGSSWFARRGVTVTAHRSCAAAMRAEHPGLIDARRRDPELAELFADAAAEAPSSVFDAELTLQAAGAEVRVLHPGHGHTRGDAVVFFPEESVVVCGDLVSNGYHVNFEDARLAGLQEGLHVLQALAVERYVPGHGAPGGRKLLERQSEYLQAVEEIVGDGMSAGDSDEEIASAVRDRFPGFLLEGILPVSVATWRTWLTGDG